MRMSRRLALYAVGNRKPSYNTTQSMFDTYSDTYNLIGSIGTNFVSTNATYPECRYVIISESLTKSMIMGDYHSGGQMGKLGEDYLLHSAGSYPTSSGGYGTSRDLTAISKSLTLTKISSSYTSYNNGADVSTNFNNNWVYATRTNSQSPITSILARYDTAFTRTQLDSYTATTNNSNGYVLATKNQNYAIFAESRDLGTGYKMYCYNTSWTRTIIDSPVAAYMDGSGNLRDLAVVTDNASIITINSSLTISQFTSPLASTYHGRLSSTRYYLFARYSISSSPYTCVFGYFNKSMTFEAIKNTTDVAWGNLSNGRNYSDDIPNNGKHIVLGGGSSLISFKI